MTNTNTRAPRALADVPHPAGATNVFDWDDRGGIDPLQRYFVGSQWIVQRGDDLDKDITVAIDGLQHADGSVERVITTAIGDMEAIDPLTSDQARQLARHLIAAADEVEEMARYDEIEVTR